MDIRNALLILHIIGTVLGVGAATVSDYLFFTFAKDGKLTKEEFATLKTVSNLVWVGLLILLVSGFGFVLLYMTEYKSIQNVYSLDKMWAKLTIVIVLLCNGFFIHRKVLPLFAQHLGKPFTTPAFKKQSFQIFASGAISAISWYSTLILGGWRGLTASYAEIMIGYLLVVAIGILISNTLGRKFIAK
jgi:hypothetical protein